MDERSHSALNSSSQSEKFVCDDIGSLGLKMVPFSPAVLFRSVSLVLCVVNSVLCPLTVAGNILVFVAVLRKSQLRTVANTSILCLAFTDLMVGVFVQPSYVVYQASKLTSSPDSFPCDKLLIYSFSGVICICMSFLTLILISLERYMAVFYPYLYVAKVNSKRVIAVTVTVWAISIGILLTVRFLFGINSNEETGVISLVIITNFLVTSFVYFKIFRLVKRSNAQVNVEMSQQTSTSEGEPPSQMNSNPREAKASKTVAFVAGTLFLCFTPTLCVTIVDQARLARRDLLYHVIYPIAETAVLLNSCVNPGIYVWRNRGIRRSLCELLRKCKLSS
ncbi:histamine H2 receptor-like [Oculina patagonica]